MYHFGKTKTFMPPPPSPYKNFLLKLKLDSAHFDIIFNNNKKNKCKYIFFLMAIYSHLVPFRENWEIMDHLTFTSISPIQRQFL